MHRQSRLGLEIFGKKPTNICRFRGLRVALTDD
jgi:hypothetical protein